GLFSSPPQPLPLMPPPPPRRQPTALGRPGAPNAISQKPTLPKKHPATQEKQQLLASVALAAARDATPPPRRLCYYPTAPKQPEPSAPRRTSLCPLPRRQWSAA
ncbi:hypothetical protein Vafri_124, partial [Volvox africanus]